MNTLNVLFGIITIFICTWCLFIALRKLYRGNSSIQYHSYLIIYLFFVFPLILQLIFKYEYIDFKMANNAMNDFFATTVYYIFVTVLSIVIVKWKPHGHKTASKEISYNPLIIKVCAFVIIFTLLYTLLTNGIGILFAGYGARLQNNKYTINETLINVAMICYLALAGQIKSIRKSLFAVLTFVFCLLIWIHGKRFILAEMLVMLVFMLSICKIIKGRTLIKLLIFCGIGIVAFSYLYGVFFKQNTSSLLDYMSIDLSRHYTLIYQFYCAKNGIDISVNKFDAVLFILLFWIPRSIWSSKPYPFSNSLTRSLLGFQPENVNLNWSTTCAIFSDLFDSFSYFGLILAMVLILKMFDLINKTNKPHYKAIGVYILIQLLTVQLASVLTGIIVCTGIFILCDCLGKNKVYKADKAKRSKVENAVGSRG